MKQVCYIATRVHVTLAMQSKTRMPARAKRMRQRSEKMPAPALPRNACASAPVTPFRDHVPVKSISKWNSSSRWLFAT